VSAYVVVQIDVKDPVAYEGYKKLTPASIAPYGGKFVVRGGKVETLEGTWLPPRFVVVEFPSVERAKAWWNSPEYAPAKKLRQSCADTEMIVVEGV
jgi:uncharacterized protein (DUF1330 family)